MTVKSYSERLQDPRWQKKRLRIMERDKFACRECGNTKNTLNVHHGCYIPGRDPWEYPDNVLRTLCEDCHERTQHVLAAVHSLLGGMSIDELRTAASVLAASGLCSLDEPRKSEEPERTLEEHLTETERRIESLDRFGDRTNEWQMSELKNLRQLAIILRDEIAKEAVTK